MYDSDEEQDMPMLSSHTNPVETMTKEEEEEIKKSLENIENRIKFFEEKMEILSSVSKKLVGILKPNDSFSSNTNNLNIES